MNLFPEKKLHNLIFNSQEIILYIFVMYVQCRLQGKMKELPGCNM